LGDCKGELASCEVCEFIISDHILDHILDDCFVVGNNRSNLGLSTLLLMNTTELVSSQALIFTPSAILIQTLALRTLHYGKW
jgi:hypothetical protein